MSNNDLWCGNCKSHHHPVECPLEEEAMRNVIKFNGRLYAMLEEGAHTIQGEIVHVVPSQERSQVPTDEIEETVKNMIENYCGENKQTHDATCRTFLLVLRDINRMSQPDSRDEMIVLMQEALEKLSHIQSTGKNAIGQYVCCGGETQRFSHYEDENNLKGRVYVQNVHKDDCFLRLIPALPATTLRLEAERKVIEAAREVVPGLVKLERPTVKALEALLEKESESPIRINPDGSIGASPKMEVLRKALAHLDSLGGGK